MPGTPLLVTGLPRTGTSWVGKMLEASREVVYVNEPLNPGHPPGRSPGVLDATVTHQYQYICRDNEDGWLPAFRHTVGLRYRWLAELRRNRKPYDLARLAKYGTNFTLGRLRGRRALLDDPFAVLSVRWFVERFGARAIVLVRDPVSMVASYRRLGWRVRFAELLGQPLLVRDLLGDDAATLRELARAGATTDEVVRTAHLWRVVYGVVDRHYRRLPGVVIQPYEELVRAPQVTFRTMYGHCGLSYDARAHRAVGIATSGSGRRRGSHHWTVRFGLSRTAFRPMTASTALGHHDGVLSAAEVARVRAITDEVASRFFPGAAREPATPHPS